MDVARDHDDICDMAFYGNKIILIVKLHGNEQLIAKLLVRHKEP
jgi:hypothetical protein